MFFGFDVIDEFCVLDEILVVLDLFGVGFGRNGVVGVVGVLGGVWLGVDGVDVVFFGVMIDDWFFDRIDIGGIVLVNILFFFKFFFISNVKFIICNKLKLRLKIIGYFYLVLTLKNKI